TDWPATERPLALACHAERGLALLSWNGSDGHTRLRLWDAEAKRLQEPWELDGARYAYAFAFLDAGTVAVRIPGRRDAPAFALDDADGDRTILPRGDVYPLAQEAIEAPFAHRVEGPPRYPVALDGRLRGVEPLRPLSLSNLARSGEARNFTDEGAHPLDSGDQRTVWHRLYAEARLPAGSGFIVWCAATAEPAPPPLADAEAWLPHRFGEVPLTE